VENHVHTVSVQLQTEVVFKRRTKYCRARIIRGLRLSLTCNYILFNYSRHGTALPCIECDCTRHLHLSYVDYVAYVDHVDCVDYVDLSHIHGHTRKIKCMPTEKWNKLRTFWQNDFKKECLVYIYIYIYIYIYMFFNLNTHVYVHKYAWVPTLLHGW
jgi:hypothetical protein